MSPTTLTIFTLIMLSVICILVFLAYKVHVMEKPEEIPKCKRDLDGSENDLKWLDTCYGFEEIFFDQTLPKPDVTIDPNTGQTSERPNKLELTKFKFTSGAGGAVAYPTWYRWRYVNANTGGFGPFSDWTDKPIIAGSNKDQLPLANTYDVDEVELEKDGCSNNNITIGLPSNSFEIPPGKPQKRYNNNLIFINVHRYQNPDKSIVSQPSDDVKTDIVGFLGGQNQFVGSIEYQVTTDVEVKRINSDTKEKSDYCES